MSTSLITIEALQTLLQHGISPNTPVGQIRQELQALQQGIQDPTRSKETLNLLYQTFRQIPNPDQSNQITVSSERSEAIRELFIELHRLHLQLTHDLSGFEQVKTTTFRQALTAFISREQGYLQLDEWQELLQSRTRALSLKSLLRNPLYSQSHQMLAEELSVPILSIWNYLHRGSGDVELIKQGAAQWLQTFDQLGQYSTNSFNLVLKYLGDHIRTEAVNGNQVDSYSGSFDAGCLQLAYQMFFRLQYGTTQIQRAMYLLKKSDNHHDLSVMDYLEKELSAHPLTSDAWANLFLKLDQAGFPIPDQRVLQRRAFYQEQKQDITSGFATFVKQIPRNFYAQLSQLSENENPTQQELATAQHTMRVMIRAMKQIQQIEDKEKFAEQVAHFLGYLSRAQKINPFAHFVQPFTAEQKELIQTNVQLTLFIKDLVSKAAQFGFNDHSTCRRYITRAGILVQWDESLLINADVDEWTRERVLNSEKKYTTTAQITRDVYRALNLLSKQNEPSLHVIQAAEEAMLNLTKILKQIGQIKDKKRFSNQVEYYLGYQKLLREKIEPFVQLTPPFTDEQKKLILTAIKLVLAMKDLLPVADKLEIHVDATCRQYLTNASTFIQWNEPLLTNMDLDEWTKDKLLTVNRLYKTAQNTRDVYRYLKQLSKDHQHSTHLIQTAKKSILELTQALEQLKDIDNKNEFDLQVKHYLGYVNAIKKIKPFVQFNSPFTEEQKELIQIAVRFVCTVKDLMSKAEQLRIDPRSTCRQHISRTSTMIQWSEQQLIDAEIDESTRRRLLTAQVTRDFYTQLVKFSQNPNPSEQELELTRDTTLEMDQVISQLKQIDDTAHFEEQVSYFISYFKKRSEVVDLFQYFTSSNVTTKQQELLQSALNMVFNANDLRNKAKDLGFDYSATCFKSISALVNLIQWDEKLLTREERIQLLGHKTPQVTKAYYHWLEQLSENRDLSDQDLVRAQEDLLAFEQELIHMLRVDEENTFQTEVNHIFGYRKFRNKLAPFIHFEPPLTTQQQELLQTIQRIGLKTNELITNGYELGIYSKTTAQNNLNQFIKMIQWSKQPRPEGIKDFYQQLIQSFKHPHNTQRDRLLEAEQMLGMFNQQLARLLTYDDFTEFKTQVSTFSRYFVEELGKQNIKELSFPADAEEKGSFVRIYQQMGELFHSLIEKSERFGLDIFTLEVKNWKNCFSWDHPSLARYQQPPSEKFQDHVQSVIQLLSKLGQGQELSDFSKRIVKDQTKFIRKYFRQQLEQFAQNQHPSNQDIEGVKQVLSAMEQALAQLAQIRDPAEFANQVANLLSGATFLQKINLFAHFTRPFTAEQKELIQTAVQLTLTIKDLGSKAAELGIDSETTCRKNIYKAGTVILWNEQLLIDADVDAGKKDIIFLSAPITKDVYHYLAFLSTQNQPSAQVIQKANESILDLTQKLASLQQIENKDEFEKQIKYLLSYLRRRNIDAFGRIVPPFTAAQKELIQTAVQLTLTIKNLHLKAAEFEIKHRTTCRNYISEASTVIAWNEQLLIDAGIDSEKKDVIFPSAPITKDVYRYLGFLSTQSQPSAQAIQAAKESMLNLTQKVSSLQQIENKDEFEKQVKYLLVYFDMGKLDAFGRFVRPFTAKQKELIQTAVQLTLTIKALLPKAAELGIKPKTNCRKYISQASKVILLNEQLLMDADVDLLTRGSVLQTAEKSLTTTARISRDVYHYLDRLSKEKNPSAQVIQAVTETVSDLIEKLNQLQQIGNKDEFEKQVKHLLIYFNKGKIDAFDRFVPPFTAEQKELIQTAVQFTLTIKDLRSKALELKVPTDNDSVKYIYKAGNLILWDEQQLAEAEVDEETIWKLTLHSFTELTQEDIHQFVKQMTEEATEPTSAHIQQVEQMIRKFNQTLIHLTSVDDMSDFQTRVNTLHHYFQDELARQGIQTLPVPLISDEQGTLLQAYQKIGKLLQALIEKARQSGLAEVSQKIEEWHSCFSWDHPSIQSQPQTLDAIEDEIQQDQETVRRSPTVAIEGLSQQDIHQLVSQMKEAATHPTPAQIQQAKEMLKQFNLALSRVTMVVDAAELQAQVNTLYNFFQEELARQGMQLIPISAISDKEREFLRVCQGTGRLFQTLLKIGKQSGLDGVTQKINKWQDCFSWDHPHLAKYQPQRPFEKFKHDMQSTIRYLTQLNDEQDIDPSTEESLQKTAQRSRNYFYQHLRSFAQNAHPSQRDLAETTQVMRMMGQAIDLLAQIRDPDKLATQVTNVIGSYRYTERFEFNPFAHFSSPPTKEQKELTKAAVDMIRKAQVLKARDNFPKSRVREITQFTNGIIWDMQQLIDADVDATTRRKLFVRTPTSPVTIDFYNRLMNLSQQARPTDQDIEVVTNAVKKLDQELEQIQYIHDRVYFDTQVERFIGYKLFQKHKLIPFAHFPSPLTEKQKKLIQATAHLICTAATDLKLKTSSYLDLSRRYIRQFTNMIRWNEKQLIEAGVDVETRRQLFSRSIPIEDNTTKQVEDIPRVQSQVQSRVQSHYPLLTRLNQSLDEWVADPTLSVPAADLNRLQQLRAEKINEAMQPQVLASLLRLQLIQLSPDQVPKVQTLLQSARQQLGKVYQPLQVSNQEMSDCFHTLEQQGYRVPPSARIHHQVFSRMSPGLTILEANRSAEVYQWNQQEISHLLEAAQLLNQELDFLMRSKQTGAIQRLIKQLCKQIRLREGQPLPDQLEQPEDNSPTSMQKRQLYRELLSTQVRLNIFAQQGLVDAQDQERLDQFYQPRLLDRNLAASPLALTTSERTTMQNRLGRYYPAHLLEQTLRSYPAKEGRARPVPSAKKHDMEGVSVIMRPDAQMER